MRLIHIEIQFFTISCHDISHLTFDYSISCPTDNIKLINNNSSTTRLWLTRMINSQTVAYKIWVVRCSPSDPVFSQSRFMNLRRIIPPLGLDKKMFNSPRFLIPLINTTNRKRESWSHLTSSFL